MSRIRTAYAVGLVSASTIGSVAWAQPGPDNPRRTPIVEVVEQVRDSIVNISATGVVQRRSGFSDFFELPPIQQKVSSVGSGFVMHEGGYIVTNHHVVAVSMDLRATFANGEEYKADVVVSDPAHDLAILHIEPKSPLKPIRLGRSDDLMIGETAIAIGNPLGYSNTVTTGIISAVNRRLEFGGDTDYGGLIQTDASINPGSSGGPLLNIQGELIGINTAIRADAQNIGFAIPVDRLRELLPDMLDFVVAEERNFELGMKIEGQDSPQVVAVEEGGTADKAGIRVGDQLVKVGGTPIHRDMDFYISMMGRSVGEKVPMTVRRNSETVDVTVALEAIPKPDGADLARRHFGMMIENANRDTAAAYGLRPPGRGVAVVGVESGSPADRGGLRPGDLLIQVGRHRITSLDDIGGILKNVSEGEPADLEWWRRIRGEVWAMETRVFAR